MLLLSTVNEEPLALNLLELLLAGLTSPATKDQLTPEFPLEWDAPFLRRTLIDDGVVVLEVGAKAFCLKRDPKRILVHSVGVLGPIAEVMCVKREGFAKTFDWLGVFIEENLKPSD